MSEAFRRLEDIGTPYFRDNLVKKEEKHFEYGKKKIAIGTMPYRNNRIFYLDMTDAIRTVVIGRAGSGKTFLLRGIADRVHKVDYSVLFCPDVKDEFKSSNKPLQKKFHHLLLENEKPEGMKIVTLRPTFFKQMSKKLPEGNLWYSPHIAQISKNDFFTLLRSEGLPQIQQVALELIYDELRTAVKKNPRITLDTITSIITEREDINPATKTSMLFKIKPLKDSHMIEEEHIKDPVQAIQAGYSVAINMENFDHFGSGGFSYPEVILSIIFRTLIHARRAKKINPFIVILDESSRFVHAARMTSFRHQVEESVDVDRRYGISLIFASQELGKLPPVILRQCRYVFVPYSADIGTIREALMMAGKLRNPQVATRQAVEWKGRMKKHQWLAIDFVDNVVEIIAPLAPLSMHAETNE